MSGHSDGILVGATVLHGTEARDEIERGTLLFDFLSECDLMLANTFCPENGPVTCVSWNQQNQKHMDYLAISRSWQVDQ
eukprot:9612669-Prorocentrum_lima.AAC.1